MDINQMLGRHECSCGMTHNCDIKTILIGSGALKQIHTLIEKYEHILLIADTNTYVVCGNAVKQQLGDKLEKLVIYECDGYLIPNEEAITTMQKGISEYTDMIVGIGSGVIQDLCKYVSYQAGLPYQVVATAPSMDGYASVGAALIINNMKVTYSAHVPEAIVGDTDILCKAPMEMIQAGYGDILGKFSCLNDWKLSHVVNGEYFCEEVYELTYDMLQKTKDLGAKLQDREEAAIRTLMEALIGVGIAMAYVGNSRPASGSEHHLSHFFEVVGILNDEPYFPHGIDVAFSSVYTQKLRDKLLTMMTSVEDARRKYQFSWETWEQEIRKVYTTAANGVIALQKKVGWYETNRLPVYEKKWQEIKTVLEGAPTTEEMNSYLESIGLNIDSFEEMYGKEKIENALKYGKDLKDRYSVLWMYYDFLISC